MNEKFWVILSAVLLAASALVSIWTLDWRWVVSVLSVVAIFSITAVSLQSPRRY